MGQPLSPVETLFRQRLLSCCGLYKGALDGSWGPQTDDAEKAFEDRCVVIAKAEGTFDARTEGYLNTLQTGVQEAARASLTRIRATGVDARILSGTRTYAEQDALYRKGRFGNPGPVVTKARGGQSWHNFGLAWDIGIFESKTYVTHDDAYKAVSGAGKGSGIEWGGDWPGKFKDFPHYEVPGGADTVASACARFEAGGRS